MEYIDKLKKVQSSLDSLENKTKEEIIDFVKLIVKMSINREEGNMCIDELTQVIHDSEINNHVKASLDILESSNNNFVLKYQFENITGFKLDKNLIQGLTEGLLVIKKAKED